MLGELYWKFSCHKESYNFICNNFNVFTGETGAGKSILINGINAILGKERRKR